MARRFFRASVRCRPNYSTADIPVVSPTAGEISAAASQWYSLSATESLTTVAGSALDFSAWPATRRVVGTLASNYPYGDRIDDPVGIANQMLRDGHKSIRWHNIDDTMARPSTPNADLTLATLQAVATANAARITQVQQFAAQCVVNGQTIIADLITNGAWATEASGWSGFKHRLMMGDAAALQVFKDFVQTYWVDTGLLSSPAISHVTILNEDAIAFLLGAAGTKGPMDAALLPYFRAWITAKFTSDALLTSYCATNSRGNDDLAGQTRANITLPNPALGGNSSVRFLVDQWINETYIATYATLKAWLITKGMSASVKVGGSQAAFTFGSDIVRGTLDYSDNHNYYDLWGQAGNASHQQSFFGLQPADLSGASATYNSYGFSLLCNASSRYFGKESHVSEWQFCSLNRYRGQAHIVPAMFAAQGIDYSYQFGATTKLSYVKNGTSNDRIQENLVWADPIDKAIDRTGLFFFGRADVQPFSVRCESLIRPAAALDSSKLLYTSGSNNHGTAFVKQWASALAWVAQVGLGTVDDSTGRWTTAGAYRGPGAAPEMKLDPMALGDLYSGDYGQPGGATAHDDKIREILRRTRNPAVATNYPTTALAGPATQWVGDVITEDLAGQIKVNHTQSLARVVTPKSELLIFGGGSVMQGQTITLLGATPDGQVFAGTLDHQPFASSSRLLLVHTTHATNSGQVPADPYVACTAQTSTKTGTVTLNGAHVAGVSSVSLATAAGGALQINAGDTFTIKTNANDTEILRATSSLTLGASATGSVSISAPLAAAHASGLALALPAYNVAWTDAGQKPVRVRGSVLEATFAVQPGNWTVYPLTLTGARLPALVAGVDVGRTSTKLRVVLRNWVGSYPIVYWEAVKS